jgi:alkanesulfonate monooxygenase
MEQWLLDDGCDGFNVMFPYVPQSLDDFVDKGVRRGLFLRDYEGKTLRENLGLPRPKNQFFSAPNDPSGGRSMSRTAPQPFENG